jgi:DNA-binding response OmpR family regulator
MTEVTAGTAVPRASILVVEDDRRTAEVIALYLRHAGHKVFVEHDGAAAIARSRAEAFDLVVLDRMLPGAEGLDVCRAIRQQGSVPVILVTARTLEEERLEGFDSGADDYLTKPFSPRELVARIHALLRRAPPGAGKVLKAGDLTVDLEARRVTVGGSSLDLTPSELEIVIALAERPGRVMRRMALLDRLPGENSETLERTIDVHVRNIRRKLGAIDGVTVRIETAFGAGYRLATAVVP